MSQFCDIKHVSLKTPFLLLEIVIHADVVNLCRFGSYVLLRLHVTHAYTSRRFLPHSPNARFRLYHLAIEISVIIFYLDCDSHMDDQNVRRTYNHSRHFNVSRHTVWESLLHRTSSFVILFRKWSLWASIVRWQLHIFFFSETFPFVFPIHFSPLDSLT